MSLWIELLIAGVVCLGVIAVARAIVTGLSISRRHLTTWRNSRARRRYRRRPKFHLRHHLADNAPPAAAKPKHYRS
jgi:hypothetical protein